MFDKDKNNNFLRKEMINDIKISSYVFNLIKIKGGFV